MRHRDIGDIGRCAMDMVHQSGKLIHPDVRLHPEIPLIPLLGLMHLRVARMVGVLGRTGRSDHSAARSEQAVAATEPPAPSRPERSPGGLLTLAQALSVTERQLHG